ncbi:hypothetical protein MMC09_003288 [Bachmanniomyces sp. S44760]|nr:hypothetical protein [Bachmanniomyces sp. S44760]
MRGFEGGSLPLTSSPLHLEDMMTAEYMHALQTLSYPEPPTSYGAGHYAGHDNTTYSPAIPPNVPQSYEQVSREYSHTPAGLENTSTSQFELEKPSLEHGNEQLNFDKPSQTAVILDDHLRHVSISFHAQLHGMFFLAESLRASVTDDSAPHIELTCYRRNLFQITGTITLPHALRYVLRDQGDRAPIRSLELGVSATESVDGSPIKIITVPWKTSASGTTASPPEDKTEKEPDSIALDLSTDQDIGLEHCSIPFSWKRLQFRVATANNGRRKELQQHFNLTLAVVATLTTGQKVTVSEASSKAIIVRGRSPRNFQQRRDYPLTGSGGSMRKSATVSPHPMQRKHSSSDSISTLASLASPKPETKVGLHGASLSGIPEHDSPGLGSEYWTNPPPTALPTIGSPTPTESIHTMTSPPGRAPTSSPSWPVSYPYGTYSRPDLTGKRKRDPSPADHTARLGLTIPDDISSHRSIHARSVSPYDTSRSAVSDDGRPRKLARTRQSTTPLSSASPNYHAFPNYNAEALLSLSTSQPYLQAHSHSHSQPLLPSHAHSRSHSNPYADIPVTSTSTTSNPMSYDSYSPNQGLGVGLGPNHAWLPASNNMLSPQPHGPHGAPRTLQSTSLPSMGGVGRAASIGSARPGPGPGPGQGHGQGRGQGQTLPPSTGGTSSGGAERTCYSEDAGWLFNNAQQKNP